MAKISFNNLWLDHWIYLSNIFSVKENYLHDLWLFQTDVAVDIDVVVIACSVSNSALRGESCALVFNFDLRTRVSFAALNIPPNTVALTSVWRMTSRCVGRACLWRHALQLRFLLLSNTHDMFLDFCFYFWEDICDVRDISHVTRNFEKKTTLSWA